MEFINAIAKFWYIILLAIMALILATTWAVKFFKQPAGERRKWLREKLFPKVTRWLLDAVAAAEKALGSGTGPKKLEMVYNQFREWFPLLAKIMPFSLFSKLVDDALDKMRELLEKQAQEGITEDNMTATNNFPT